MISINQLGEMAGQQMKHNDPINFATVGAKFTLSTDIEGSNYIEM